MAEETYRSGGRTDPALRTALEADIPQTLAWACECAAKLETQPHMVHGEVRLSLSGIRALRAGAETRGDLATVDLCDEALAGGERARAECDRVSRASQAENR